MKWRFEHVKQDNYVRITDEGVFNIEDHKEKIRELVEQDFWKPGINLLFNLTKVDFTGVSNEKIQETAETFVNNDNLIGCGKMAILMRSVADFGLGRQFEMLTDEKICADVGVFLDENQALRWLLI